jgi:hypothetical protein
MIIIKGLLCWDIQSIIIRLNINSNQNIIKIYKNQKIQEFVIIVPLNYPSPWKEVKKLDHSRYQKVRTLIIQSNMNRVYSMYPEIKNLT